MSCGVPWKLTPRRFQDLSQQLAEERAKVNTLRNRNAALEQQLANYGSMSTPTLPAARRRSAFPSMPPHGAHSHHAQQVQHLSPRYAELDGPQDQLLPASMSPMVTSRPPAQYAPAVPGTPLRQPRMARGMRPPSVVPADIQSGSMVPPPPPQPQHVGPSQPYDESQDVQDYTTDHIRADYAAKRQRLDPNNA